MSLSGWKNLCQEFPSTNHPIHTYIHTHIYHQLSLRSLGQNWVTAPRLFVYLALWASAVRSGLRQEGRNVRKQLLGVCHILHLLLPPLSFSALAGVQDFIVSGMSYFNRLLNYLPIAFVTNIKSTGVSFLKFIANIKKKCYFF